MTNAPTRSVEEIAAENETLRAKIKEAHDTIDQLRAIRPQAFIMSRASEWSRLFREVHGYLRVCHGKHGTDWDGRQHAMDALLKAEAELAHHLKQGDGA